MINLICGKCAFILLYLTFFPFFFITSSFPIIHIYHLLHVDANIISSSMSSYIQLLDKYISIYKQTFKGVLMYQLANLSFTDLILYTLFFNNVKILTILTIDLYSSTYPIVEFCII